MIASNPIAASLFTAALLFATTGACRAESAPAGQADDTRRLDCLITNDLYAVHLTIYQVPSELSNDTVKAGFKPYCQELPQTGRTYITLDLLDRDVRTLPMTVRVQRESEEGPPTILSEIPRRTYPAGVVEAVADLPEPGHYSVVLAMGESRSSEDPFVIRMTVGSPYSVSAVLPYALIGLVALGGILALLPRLRLTSNEEHDPWKLGKGSSS